MYLTKSTLAAFFIGCTLMTSVSAAIPAPTVPPVVAGQQANLNTATLKVLRTLKGLNASKARAIIAWRKQHGPFVSVEDLHKVAGFKRLEGENWQEMKQNFTVS